VAIKRAEQQDEYSTDAQVARDYYNSSDADTFYSTIWGGTDIHVGLYRGVEGLSDIDDIAAASVRTVERMAANLTLDRSVMVLDRSEERRVGKECRCRWSPDH